MIKINYFYLFFIIFLFIFTLISGGIFPNFIFYTSFFIFIISLIYVYLLKKNLSVKIELKNNIYTVGDSQECITSVCCFLPVPYIEVKPNFNINTDNKNLIYYGNITIDEYFWIVSKIKFIKRGLYDFGKIDLTVIDLFHLFKLKKKIDENIIIKVYPKIFKINKIPSGGKDIYKDKIDKNSNIINQYLIKDIRKYREGDSLKRIHWKLSSKHSELLVKNYETISGFGSCIFLDMGKNNYNYDNNGVIEEKLIDYFISIVFYLISNNISIKIFINCYKKIKMEINNLNDFNKLLDFLVKQISDGVIDFSQFIHEKIYQIDKMNKIQIVTIKIDNRFKDNILKLYKSGYSISIFYCIENQNNNSIKYLKKIGINCYLIDNFLK